LPIIMLVFMVVLTLDAPGLALNDALFRLLYVLEDDDAEALLSSDHVPEQVQSTTPPEPSVRSESPPIPEFKLDGGSMSSVASNEEVLDALSKLYPKR